MVKMVKIVDIVKYQQGNPLQETVMQRDVRRRNDARRPPCRTDARHGLGLMSIGSSFGRKFYF